MLAAELTDAEVESLLPLPMREVDDPEATAEPGKGALIKLAGRPFVVVFFGRESHRLVVEVPRSADAAADVRSFLAEVPIPRSKIVWHREDVELPAESDVPVAFANTKR